MWPFSVLCQRKEVIDDLKSTVATLKSQNDKLINELSLSDAEGEELRKQLESLKNAEKVDGVVPQRVLLKIKEIREKYPLAEVRYAGYPIRLKDKVVKPNILVQDFIHPLPSHKAWLEGKAGAAAGR